MTKHGYFSYLDRALSYGIEVDDCDIWLLDYLPWRVTAKGYVECTYYVGKWRKTVKLHHFIVGTPIYECDETDHFDGNKLNNRRNNIAIVTRYQNAQNKDQVRNAIGVKYNKGAYEARIQRNGVKYYGYGRTEDAARYECQVSYARGQTSSGV